MADKVEVNAEALHTAADKTAQVHDQVRDILSSLQNALSAKGTPWGNDEYGQRFAGGENGYLAQSGNQTDGIATIATSFDHFATTQSKATDALTGVDGSNARGFGADS
ncbi:hypothetical protein [Nocardia aurantiaca]|uniref:WXG100 family type VII secretion target n=1 Tax=Nocardia aurantiaca TaxID=2675850 RepID=A0A6I3L8S2_9NOCA|nr:hypothetical protein [Nocardia aurantiaca]MTE16259.1 hypothetical protein [Nocardia aurantiaca]